MDRKRLPWYALRDTPSCKRPPTPRPPEIEREKRRAVGGAMRTLAEVNARAAEDAEERDVDRAMRPIDAVLEKERATDGSIP